MSAVLWADHDDTRTRFSAALSDMYAKEVPLYAELLDLVSEVNQRTIARDAALRKSLEQRHELGAVGVR